MSEQRIKSAAPKPQDFRLFLQQELVSRCAKNPHYSLRAFASTLSINPGTLSTILAGKRKLTKTTIRKLGAQLLLSPLEIQRYCHSSQNNTDPLKAKVNIPYVQMELDIFTATSEWYHDAILELTGLRSFRPNPRWIAKVLGITVAEVNMAVERLQRLKLLTIEDGIWRDLSVANQVGTAPLDTSIALRRYQQEILNLSLKALEETPRERRDHTSTMLTIRLSDLAEVKEHIRKFRADLAGVLRRSKGDHDQVYQLAVSFFPITKIEENI